MPPNAGSVATLAGNAYGYLDGPLAQAMFRSPHGLALDALGNLYVADTNNHCVRKVGANGVVSTLAGSPTSSALAEPYGIAVDRQQEVYVSDTLRDAVYRISPHGDVSLIAGAGEPGFADGAASAAAFNDPRGLAVDAQGTLYVADLNNHRIREIDASGIVTTMAGSATPGSADGQGGAATFMSPIGVAVDPAGNLVVADNGAQAIRRVSPTGLVTTVAGSGSAGDADGTATDASFRFPWAIAADAPGNLYVVDGDRASRIRRVDPSGAVTTLAGSNTAGFQNGVGSAVRFQFAFALTANTCGRLLVSDGFMRIREVQ